MTHVEVLVEELSAERALRHLIPLIVPSVSFDVRTFNGKPDLLRKLPGRLAGYSTWIRQADTVVVVLTDQDDDDCIELKQGIEEEFARVGLVTLSQSQRGLDGCTRIAVEELEAWFFGDVPALISAFPGVSPSLAQRRGYRDPDAIAGGTAEALERVLDKAGYGSSLRKVATAEAVAPFMDVEANRSRSFQVFRDGIRRLTSLKES
ncbi:DUF4276 family protein [Kineococcus sp. GCM10028916]|uniref:DUF4276 family protein n=1 Tax=Kineococcus sp. GCM10028916 TaxID=3273394 RepID=UPI00363A0DCF